MKIKSVIVVGGGSSGWMTAAALYKKFGSKLKISVIEGKTSNPVGVGESTIIPFNQFLDLVGLKDEDWMKHCNASYKTSIRFTNFAEGNGEVFEYPFGGQNTEESFGQWAALAATHDLDRNSFCEFLNSNYFLAKYNRLTKNKKGDLPNFNFQRNTAFHFDASLFGKYLKTHVCKDVQTFIDDIVSINKDEDGYITSLVGDSGKEYTCDLYVDCTGFKSMLLEKEMDSRFISFKPWLSNDRALATHLPYTDKKTQLTNVTNCTALSSGWSWNIPLWSRMGTGYVYSSDFIDDDSAEKEFKEYLGTEDVELRKINIRHGARERAWVKNVVGIGLSYGFIEPLESTGLVSTHKLLENLVELLDRRDLNISGFDRDGFNYSSQCVLMGYRDFVSIHYKLSNRTDTPYWKYQTEIKDWFKLRDQEEMLNVIHSHAAPGNEATPTPAYYEQVHMAHSTEHRWSSEVSGISYIMAGMGQRPYGEFLANRLGYNKESLKDLYQQWREHVKIMENHVKTLPSTYEFLKQNIYH